MLSSGVPFGIALYVEGNMNNLDAEPRNDISAKPSQFAHIATWISFLLIVGQGWDIANSAAILDLKIVPSDLLLTHYASSDCITDARILALI